MTNTNTPQMDKKNFKVGGIYDVEYMNNADLRHPVKIVKMTEKTVWFSYIYGSEMDKVCRKKLQWWGAKAAFMPGAGAYVCAE
jgi:hypothetical protein